MRCFGSKNGVKGLLGLVFFIHLPASAQLNRVFEDLFNQILIDDLKLSPSLHGNHFIEAAGQANRTLTPSLNSLIAGNISSFPLSSTSIGVTFDFTSGKPVAVKESLGPIFAETGETLGKNKLNLGVNHTRLTLDRLRGLPTEQIRFTFTHVDVTEDATLGESPNESDTIDLFLDMDVDADISVLFATWGVTNHFDLSVAVPYVEVRVEGNALAQINSFTFANMGEANHNFGADPSHPNLINNVAYGGTASGIGDISFRMKYAFLRQTNVQLAFLLDVRFPTGDEADFLGSGDHSIRLAEILSKKIGSLTTHLNLAYEQRGAELDSDELEIDIGFDQQLGNGFTWAVEVLADFDINDKEVIELFPGSTTIVDQVGEGRVVRSVDLSNIPERSNDNTVDLSLGFRYAPWDHWSFLANVLVPPNDGGLRSEIVPTVGLSASF